MTHSLVKVIIHYVWTTKNRARMLTGDSRHKVKEHMEIYAGENKIILEALDVQPDHAHVVVDLSSDHRVGDVPKLLKGESSHWINQQDLVTGRFSWQTGYAGFSVSCDALERVKGYVLNQDDHHRRRTFAEEFKQMLKEAGYSATTLSAFVQDHDD